MILQNSSIWNVGNQKVFNKTHSFSQFLWNTMLYQKICTVAIVLTILDIYTDQTFLIDALNVVFFFIIAWRSYIRMKLQNKMSPLDSNRVITTQETAVYNQTI